MESSHQQLTSTNLFDVKDLVVVVTGGGTGIGQMMTRALIANGARKVYIVGRRLDVLETTASEYASSAPGKIIPIQADLSSKSQIDGLRKKLEAEEKYIDILVSCAC
jgi:NADP-dependent 3-hydroxy acid dehydrogenase YdfG